MRRCKRRREEELSPTNRCPDSSRQPPEIRPGLRLPHTPSSPQLPLRFIHFPLWPLLRAPPFSVNLQQVWAAFFERSSTAGRRGPPAPSPPLSSATALISLPREVVLRLHYPRFKCVQGVWPQLRFRAFRSLKVVLNRSPEELEKVY